MSTWFMGDPFGGYGGSDEGGTKEGAHSDLDVCNSVRKFKFPTPSKK